MSINLIKKSLALFFVVILIYLFWSPFFSAKMNAEIRNPQSESLINKFEILKKNSTPEKKQSSTSKDEPIKYEPIKKANPNIKSIKSLFKDLDPHHNWILKKEGPIIRVVYGGIITKQTQTDSEVDSFLDRFLEEANIEHKDRSVLKITDGVDEKIIYSQQKIDEIPIYGTQLKLFIKKPENGVVYIINEFQNFSQVYSNKLLSADELNEIIFNHYNSEKLEINDCHEVYFIKNDIALLSQVCQIEITEPLILLRKIILDAGTGEILKEESNSISN